VLEKLAIDVPTVCIMNPLIQQLYTDDVGGGSPESGPTTSAAKTMEYFMPLKKDIGPERRDKIISKSGEKLGEYDFFFEWFKTPNVDELNNLIKMIDKALAPWGASTLLLRRNNPSNH